VERRQGGQGGGGAAHGRVRVAQWRGRSWYRSSWQTVVGVWLEIGAPRCAVSVSVRCDFGCERAHNVCLQAGRGENEESARFADLSTNRRVYDCTFFTFYTLIHLRIHIDTSSYLNKAPRHDDASTLHNLMALGPVAPAQRAARREPGSGVWCRLITCSFDGGLSSDRTPQCGAALSIPHTPHTSPPHNEGRPGLPRPSQTPEKRTARQEPRTRSTDHSF
jgi:hypothetical protein